MSAPTSIAVAFVTGTRPDKWFRRYRERSDVALEAQPASDATAQLLCGAVDVALTRIPDPRLDPQLFHVVVLYREEPGLAVPRDSVAGELVRAGGQLTAADVAEEVVHYRPDATGPVDVAAVRMGLDVVAAGVGIVLAPRPLIQVLSHRGVVDTPWQPAEKEICDSADASKAPDAGDGGQDTAVVLAWRKSDDCAAIQDLVGIARGRTAASSRTGAGRNGAQSTAAEKTAAQHNGGKQNGAKAKSAQTGQRSQGGKKGGAVSGRGRGGQGQRGRHKPVAKGTRRKKRR
ncbi:LysR family transcriptional regulator substrate-binding protein [Corynebacterium uberis]|uniref:LysR family transcriptional regulator substrate-binding protein n=1 Tax=Corynebacterium TaxID=1716 RepID=UPI001D0B657B|nr:MULTISPECIES: LysR family transcriptional regulator substrate-binding protein [Corynebacterium]MCZ9308884.1 LysR family transcriptional regulator substrate-binding protein [Corynebacterium sp. c6VSa_13]UDL74640.1 LysR family transcriptional regulator substrate-binding protein [Corynebacterium uberis]UDL76526.1 LysR family transcriptional regulator substrate-binding protein [Corynebacterium uberis]UDL78738.1 LysR family transcriptional regulator substrate-binding protein [Corynebacterium uber